MPVTTIAKQVLVSPDGNTYYDLPGMSGEWHDDATAITDTIFGQTFDSTQTGLIAWSVVSQAYYKGFAGYAAKLLKSGTPTAFTAEAMAHVSGQIYKISSAAKEIWDHTAPATIKDGVTDVTNQVADFNWLFGTITFKNTYTVLGAVTADGTYLPMSDLAKANSFTLTQTQVALDKTDFEIAHANNGYKVFTPGLRTIQLQLGGFYAETEKNWEVLQDRKNIVVEINPDGSGLSLCRGFFKMLTRQQAGNVGQLETETRTLHLQVPPDMTTVFSWVHDPSTTLSLAVRTLLDSFINQTNIFVKYAPNGLDDTLFYGSGVLTDVSLTSGLAAMNDFKATIQGSDEPVRVIVS